MIIFKDLFSGDELFSDMIKIDLMDETVYKIKGTMRTDVSDVDERLIGGNKSAEGADDGGADSTAKQGVDIVMNGRLVEYTISKNDYRTHIKEYMKNVKEKLQADKPEEVDVFTKKVQPFIKQVLAEFKEYQFFCGESMHPDGMLAMMKWEDTTPYMYFFKHGLDAEKV